MNKEVKISLVSLILLLGFLIANFTSYFKAFYLHMMWPYNTHLFLPSDSFHDLTNYLNGEFPFFVKNLDYVYFPFAYIFFNFISLFNNQFVVFLYLLFATLLFFYLNSKYLILRNNSTLQNFQNLSIFTLLSYPYLFNIDRANIELLIFSVVGFAIYYFYSEQYNKSLLLFLIAGLFKPFYFIFFILFMERKRYKEIFIAICFWLIITFLSFIILSQGIVSPLYQVNIFIENLKLNFQHYVVDCSGIAYNSSLYSSLLILGKYFYKNNFDVDFLLKIYKLFIGIMGPLLIFLAYFIKSKWQKMFLIVSVFCFIPFYGEDYRLIYYFLPFYLFVNNKDMVKKMDLIYTILFALLFIPKNYWFLKFNLPYSFYSIQIILNDLIISFILISIIYFFVKDNLKNIFKPMKIFVKSAKNDRMY